MHDGRPQTVGPYRLLRRVGRGGFADVWLAERDDPSGQTREVALKLVDTSVGHREGMRPDALLREARLVSWLDDPSIVRVEAADIEGDLIWMAMEYCDGGSVTRLLKRLRARGLPMPPAVAVRIGRDVALALAAAHSAESPDGEPLCVVHRDLKPGNVLLTTQGEIKVCDFGIAKATDETNVTGTGLLKGTASYVAPELWHDVRAFSPASDAFALGTLLVEMLTMERLHAGGAMPMVYRRIVEGTGHSDAERVAKYCPPAIPLLEGLLQRDPEQRMRDMAGVATDLEELLKAMPGPADPGLLLRLLDHADGLASSPSGLPLRVGQAWQVLVKSILDVDLFLVPGPGGEQGGWELPMHPPEEVEEPEVEPVTGFGPPELRTSSDRVEAIKDEDVDTQEPTKPFVLEPDRVAVASNLWTPAGVKPVDGPEPTTQLWSGPVGGRAKPRPPSRAPDDDLLAPRGPIDQSLRDRTADDREIEQTTSYTNLVPAEEAHLPPASLPRGTARTELETTDGKPRSKPRRRKKKQLPWVLIGIAFVLWGLLVALVVAVAS